MEKHENSRGANKFGLYCTYKGLQLDETILFQNIRLTNTRDKVVITSPGWPNEKYPRVSKMDAQNFFFLTSKCTEFKATFDKTFEVGMSKSSSGNCPFDFVFIAKVEYVLKFLVSENSLKILTKYKSSKWTYVLPKEYHMKTQIIKEIL